jgi:phospho-N-acetylmuramoyl-pentapeptide-transferase
LALSFVFTFVLIKAWVLPALRAKKAGQKIYELAPESHQSKSGTPTMGGIGFIMGILLTALVAVGVAWYFGRQAELIPMAFTLALALLNGMIGFVDDFTKLYKKQYKGLTPTQKLVLQIAVAAVYVLAMYLTDSLDTVVRIPFTKLSLDFGMFYCPFAVVLIAGMSNAVNLTDGVDGLASSVMLVSTAFFAVLAFVLQDLALQTVTAAILGGCLGFLVFNAHPAKLFMGDTGSLFLGGAIAGMAIMAGEPLVVLLAGAVFIFETLSVMLQVTYFKLTKKLSADHVGRRIFRKAPLHHHFEECGWSENKVVLIFALVQALFCLLAWFSL